MANATSARDVLGFEDAAGRAADALRSSHSVLVVGHIDADGITSTAIASMALTRHSIDHEVWSVKKLDEGVAARAMSDPSRTVWFVDLGSGALSMLRTDRVVITDHHHVDPSAGPRDGHVNPHEHGLDGATEVSGSGVTYLVAKMMSASNTDLSPLAVVGAVGDLQDSAEGHLVGYNRTILGDAISLGLVKAEKDIRLFGRQTRPLHAFLQYSSEPSLLPLIKARQGGIRARDEGELEDDDKLACIDFLVNMEVGIEGDGRFRTWSDLTLEEKRRIMSELANRMMDQGKGLHTIRRMVGEVYTLSPDLPGTPAGWMGRSFSQSQEGTGQAWRPSQRALMDAKEFATLLNACGRHDKANTGVSVCLGDRGDALTTALHQQDDHRRRLREAIELVRVDQQFRVGVFTADGRKLTAIRFFHGQDRIEDTIVGTVAGMLLESQDVPSDRPLIGFASAQDGTCSVKVSGRGTREMIRQGLDLSSAMRSASMAVGGSGGGHNIAAGATVPEGMESVFLVAIDAIITAQLRPSAR